MPGPVTVKPTNDVNSKPPKAENVAARVGINYSLAVVSTTVGSFIKNVSTKVGTAAKSALRSGAAATAVVGVVAAAGIYQDVQKYDGKDAAKAIVVTAVAAAATVGVGIAIAAAAPAIAATVFGIATTSVYSSVAVTGITLGLNTFAGTTISGISNWAKNILIGN